MPWYNGDYPPSYKNQPKKIRDKATEIANEVLKTTATKARPSRPGSSKRVHILPTWKKIRQRMSSGNNLKRFLEAQARDYATALTEIKCGRKRSHWMWYIFPQINGLGYSEMAKRYAITDLPEAAAYLAHPILGPRLMEITRALLALPGSNANEVMDSPDDQKLRSSITLFSLVPGADPVFEAVLKKYFDGQKDPATLQLV